MSAQGGDPRKLLEATGENESVDTIQWSPEGGRLAYVTTRRMPDKTEATIRTINLSGSKPTVVVSDTLLLQGPFVSPAFSWVSEGRLIYSRLDPSATFFGGDSNLWEVPVDAGTGEPSGKPKQLTRWAGFLVEDLSSAADGKRVAFRRGPLQAHAYVEDLETGGTRMLPPRRLSFSEAAEFPYAWTSDSKAVIIASDRNGHFELFKQPLDQETAEPLVTGSHTAFLARLSADGSWVLYTALSKSFGPSTPFSLMRVPVSGGPPQVVLEARNWAKFDFKCARAPARFAWWMSGAPTIACLPSPHSIPSREGDEC